MNDLMKFKKDEIIEKLGIVNKELIEERIKVRVLERERVSFKKEFDDNVNAIAAGNRKLKNIQQALITAAALMHPDAQLESQYDSFSQLKIDRRPNEPEGLLLLRHLHSLSF